MVAKFSKPSCIYCKGTGHTEHKMTVSGCCPFCTAGKKASAMWWVEKKKKAA